MTITPRLKGLLTCAMAALLALHAGEGRAILLTTPVTVPVGADVDNDITIIVSDTDLGTFSATGHAVDTASASFTPGGSVSNDPGAGAGLGSSDPASLVWSPADQPETPTVELSAAGFLSAPFMVTYGGVTDLSCTGGGTIRITRITDDLATPSVWDKPGPGAPTVSAGHDFLDGAGARTFHIGLTLATTAGHAYSSGACTGSIEFVVEYG